MRDACRVPSTLSRRGSPCHYWGHRKDETAAPPDPGVSSKDRLRSLRIDGDRVIEHPVENGGSGSRNVRSLNDVSTSLTAPFSLPGSVTRHVVEGRCLST